MELDNLLNEIKLELEKSTFQQDFYFSYSSLYKLYTSPALFHHLYILKIREDKEEQHLIDGFLIHMLLLAPQQFSNHFIIIPQELPKANIKKILDDVYIKHRQFEKEGCILGNNLEDYSNVILDVLIANDLHQKLKTDQQRLEKILTEENKNYWLYLLSKDGKTIIDQELYNRATEACDAIKKNRYIYELMGMNVSDYVEYEEKEVINERYLAVPPHLDYFGFGLRGIVDNIVIDHKKKTIYINDLKTSSSKSIKDFTDSLNQYAYWIQAAIYVHLVNNVINNVFNYDVVFTFVYIDKYNQCYPFEVSKETLKEWDSKFMSLLKDAKWHFDEKNFNLPKSYELKLIKL